MSEGARHAQAILATMGAIVLIPWTLSVLSLFKFSQDYLFSVFLLGSLTLVSVASVLLGLHVYWWLV